MPQTAPILDYREDEPSGLSKNASKHQGTIRDFASLLPLRRGGGVEIVERLLARAGEDADHIIRSSAGLRHRSCRHRSRALRRSCNWTRRKPGTGRCWRYPVPARLGRAGTPDLDASFGSIGVLRPVELEIFVQSAIHPICRAVFTSWNASSRASRQSTHSSSSTPTRPFGSVGPSLPQGKRSLVPVSPTGTLRRKSSIVSPASM